MASKRRAAAQGGFTFLELIATATILMILASAILPTAKVMRIRNKEIELRRELRTMRNAVDRYKLAVDQGKIGGTDVKLGSEGYPPDLETLVEGVSQVGEAGLQAEVPAPDSHRPHDGEAGVAHALLPGRRG
jgi:general secretion pathway protein G